MRRREPGETYTDSDGTEVVAEGGERVWDHADARPGFRAGALLCNGHLNRIRSLIAGAPEMVGWMREQLEPVGNPLGGEEVHGPNGPVSKPPISVTAVDAADEVLALLCSWSECAAEGLGIAGPDTVEAYRVFRTALDIDEAGNDAGWDWTPIVKGFRGNTSLSIINAVSRWLVDNLDEIAHLEFLGQHVQEIADNRSTNLARWPYEDRPRPVAGIECDECGKRTVMFYPPAVDPKYIDEVIRDDAGKPIRLVKHVGHGKYARTVPMRYADGRDVVAFKRRLAYSYPVLIQCRDTNCGHVIPADRWQKLAREIEKGKSA
jgi:hypothetical protein